MEKKKKLIRPKSRILSFKEPLHKFCDHGLID